MCNGSHFVSWRILAKINLKDVICIIILLLCVCMLLPTLSSSLSQEVLCSPRSGHHHEYVECTISWGCTVTDWPTVGYYTTTWYTYYTRPLFITHAVLLYSCHWSWRCTSKRRTRPHYCAWTGIHCGTIFQECSLYISFCITIKALLNTSSNFVAVDFILPIATFS